MFGGRYCDDPIHALCDTCDSIPAAIACISILSPLFIVCSNWWEKGIETATTVVQKKKSSFYNQIPETVAAN